MVGEVFNGEETSGTSTLQSGCHELSSPALRNGCSAVGPIYV